MSSAATTTELSSAPAQVQQQTQAQLQTYAGNDITTIVLDPGSYSTRIGFAGLDHPSVISESNYAYDQDAPNVHLFEEHRIQYPKVGREVGRVIENGGVVKDFDIASKQWRFLLEKKMGIFPEADESYANLPMILTEPIWNPIENRIKSIELILEEMKFEAMYLLQQQSSISFAMGKPNCLIVDLGHDTCSVSPVLDGFTLASKTKRSYLNGAFLTELFRSKLLEKSEKCDEVEGKLELISNFEVKSKNNPFLINRFQGLTRSFRDNYNERFFIQECKELMLKCKPTVDLPGLSNGSPARSIEAPWGEPLVFKEEERYELVDQLINPDLTNLVVKTWAADHNDALKTWHNDYIPVKRSTNSNATTAQSTEQTPDIGANIVEESSQVDVEINDSITGLIDLIKTTIENVDIDFRPTLTNNIIITGGLSYIPGLISLIQLELTKQMPSFKIRIVTQGNSAMTKERLYQTWLGGSILGSLGSFQQLYVGKQELEEVGVERLLKSRFR
ncbi:hypothetical protein QEN19_001353 [Hanseniaspora menglaensis]